MEARRASLAKGSPAKSNARTSHVIWGKKNLFLQSKTGKGDAHDAVEAVVFLCATRETGPEHEHKSQPDEREEDDLIEHLVGCIAKHVDSKQDREDHVRNLPRQRASVSSMAEP